MRHFFIARPVATLSRGMAASSRLTILVALAGALDRAAPGALGDTAQGSARIARGMAGEGQSPAQ
jgi:hypothetical protein